MSGLRRWHSPRRRAAGLARLAPEVQRRRLMGLLLRRGFSTAVVNDVLAQVLADLSSDAEDAGAGEFDEDDERAAAFSDG